MLETRVGRRSLLKAAGAAAVGSVLPLRAFGQEKAGAPTRPIVAVVVSGQDAGRTSDVPGDKVSLMVGEAVKAVTDAADAASGWKTLFNPADFVAVKVNTLAGKALSTHPSVVAAVVAGLVSAGVEPGRIVVFDRSEREMRRAGYTIGTDAAGVRYAGTDAADFGYTQEIVTSGSISSLMSRIVTDHATAIVNVPVLKDHDLSGVSLGMKNFYGVIHNPHKYHANGCDPYIADLSASPHIRGKLRLVVIDGLVAQADGGPAYLASGAHNYAGIIVGTDPVATDRVGWAELDKVRGGMGHKSLEEAGRKPKHILTAADMGLGVADMGKITVARLAL